MNLTRYCLIWLFFFSCTHQEKNTASNHIIALDEFLELYQDEAIKIIDFRHPNAYGKNHIKGAVNIWRPDIEDISYPFGGIMASKQQLEYLFSNLGINTSDTLLVYDDRGLCEATRLWWILQQYGFTNIRMLNGGYTTLVNNGVKLTKVEPEIIKTKFSLPNEIKYKHHISKEALLSVLPSKATIIDTRTEEEFTGRTIKKGAFKAGRIPNSILIDWSIAIDYNGSNKIKSIKELEDIFGKQLGSKKNTIIVYCHSGVRSSHTTFVLTEILGYENVFNYDGSWIEWSYDDKLPFEIDNLSN